MTETCRVTGGPTSVDASLHLCIGDGTPCGRPAYYELHSWDYDENPQGVPRKGTFSFVCKAHGEAWVFEFPSSGWKIAKALIDQHIIEEDVDARDLLVTDDRQRTP